MLIHRQMLNIPCRIALAACVIALCACSIMTPRPVTPIAEVVTLGKSGAPERAVDRLTSSKTT